MRSPSTPIHDAAPAIERLAAAGLQARRHRQLGHLAARRARAPRARRSRSRPIVTAAAVGAAKPDPEAVPGCARAPRRRGRAAASTSATIPSTDVAGARAAGLSAVLVDRSGRAPDSLRRPRGARGAARGGCVTPPVARDPALRVPGIHLLFVAGVVLVSYVRRRRGAARPRPGATPTSSTRPISMLLAIVHLRRDRRPSVLWAARQTGDARRALGLVAPGLLADGDRARPRHRGRRAGRQRRAGADPARGADAAGPRPRLGAARRAWLPSSASCSRSWRSRSSGPSSRSCSSAACSRPASGGASGRSARRSSPPRSSRSRTSSRA